MNTFNDSIRQHYESGIRDHQALLTRLGQLVDDLGDPLTASGLATFDQFHVGGLVATVELAKRAGIRPGTLLLDAGSGLGGPSRYLAQTFDCRVEGIDLSPDYVAISQLLTQRMGLHDRLSYRVGDLTELPFENARFELVWTQHVVMNIRDRERLYRELRRVLKPGGRLAFYDPLAADGAPDPVYPLPWAATPQTSTLLTRDDTVAALARAGFAMVTLDDVTPQATAWLSGQPVPQPAVLSLAMVLGTRLAEMVANFGRNLQDGRLRLFMGIFQAL